MGLVEGNLIWVTIIMKLKVIINSDYGRGVIFQENERS